ncbi:MAG: hypothetical protein ACFFAQ_16600 [Promethearchaeota archaeon]
MPFEVFFGNVYGEELGKIHGTKGTYYFDVLHENYLHPMMLKKHSRRTMTRNPG